MPNVIHYAYILFSFNRRGKYLIFVYGGIPVGFVRLFTYYLPEFLSGDLGSVNEIEKTTVRDPHAPITYATIEK